MFLSGLRYSQVRCRYPQFYSLVVKHQPFIYPSIDPFNIAVLSSSQSQSGWSLLYLLMGARQGIPRTAASSSQGHTETTGINKPCTITLTPTIDLESPANRTRKCFWTVGGSQNTKRKPTQTCGELPLRKLRF